LMAMMSKPITPASPADDLILIEVCGTLVTSISSPPAVATAVVPSGTSLALRAAPGTTWRRRTAVRASLSARRPLRASAGILAKASLVGAKTVKGPSPDKVSTSPAALTAASRVERAGVAMASSAIVLVGAGGADL